MKDWPVWLKVLAAVGGVAVLVAISQIMLHFDKLSSSKFDL